MNNIEQNTQELQIHIHKPEEYKKFKEFAKSKGKDPIKYLYEIHNQMGIPENEKGHFGPKTVEFLEGLYKQEQVDEAKKLAQKSEYQPVVNENQADLDKLNKRTLKLVRRNNEKTRKDVGDTINGTIGIGYESKTQTNTRVDTNEWTGWTGKLYTQEKGEKHKYVKNAIDSETGEKVKAYYIYDPNNKYENDLFGGLDNKEVKGKDLLDIWQEKYKNASAKEKIDMARTISSYMNDFGYDRNMAGSADGSDVKSEDLWETYKNGGVAGVCRHHHSEVAKFLESVGIKSGVLTTNSGVRHTITMGKLENGNYFLIDYGDYFESKSFLDMKEQYLASKGAIDLKEWIGDADGETLKIVQTALEKELEKTASSTGNGSDLDYSKALAKDGIIVVNGFNIQANLNNKNSKNIQIKTGTDTKFGHYEAGAFYNETNGLGYANYQSYGAFINGKWGDRYATFGELGAGVKLAQHKFNWETGKKATYNTLSMNIDWTKNLVNNDTDQVNIGASAQGTLLFDKTNRDSSYALVDTSLGKIQDGAASFGATIDWKHKFNDNWTGNLGAMYGFDAGVKNIRQEELALFSKYGLYGGLDYTKGNFGVGVSGAYEKGLGYEEYKVEGHLRKGKKNKTGTIEATASYQKESDTTKFNFKPKTEARIGINYNVTDSLKTHLYGYKKNDMGQKSSGVGARVEWKF